MVMLLAQRFAPVLDGTEQKMRAPGTWLTIQRVLTETRFWLVREANYSARATHSFPNRQCL